MRWPNECPTKSDFQLWRDPVKALCPSCQTHTRLGPFTAPTHKIWQWTWYNACGCLCRASDNKATEDAFVADKKPNRFHFSHTRPFSGQGTTCSVEPTHTGGGWRLTSVASMATTTPAPQTFLDVLYSWGNTWLCDNISITGGFEWLHKAIQDGSLVDMMDGLYIQELYPNLCSTAFWVRV